jgi:hypothetical protein
VNWRSTFTLYVSTPLVPIVQVAFPVRGVGRGFKPVKEVVLDGMAQTGVSAFQLAAVYIRNV